MPKAIKPNPEEWLAPFLLAVVALAVASVAVWAIHRMRDRNEATVSTGPNLAAAQRVQTLIEMQSGATRAYLLTRDTVFLENRSRFAARIDSTFDSWDSMPLSPEGVRMAHLLKSQYTAYDDLVDEALKAGIGEAGETKRADFLLREMQPRLLRLDSLSSALTANLKSTHQRAVEEARASTERGVGWVTLTCALGLILASALTAGLNRRLNRARRQRDRYLASLREKENLLATVTDNASRALAFQDAQGLCTFMNPAAAQLTGYTPQEVLGKNLHDFLHLTRPDGTPYPFEECALFKAVTTGRRQQGEEFIRKKDGTFIPIDFTTNPVLEDGHPVGMVVEAEDITRLKEAERRRDEYEQALQRANDNLSLAAKAGGIGIWDLDPEGHVFHCSESLWEMVGLSPAGSMSFDQVFELVHPDDREMFKAAFERAMDPSGADEFELEHRITLPDRSVRWFRNKGVGSFFESEVGRRLERVRGAAVDITDRKLTEQALRASDERFQTLAKATNDAVYDWDVKAGPVWWNQGVKTMFGFEPDRQRLDFAWWSSRIHPEDRMDLTRSLTLALAGEGETWQAEYRFQCSDGTYKVVFDRGFMIRDGEGRTARMIGAIMDVTAMRQVEEELRRFRLLVEETNDLIGMSDFTGRCEYLNAGGRRLAGLEEDRKDLGNIFDYVFEEDRDAAARIWTEAMEVGQWQGEFRLRQRETGKAIPVLWNIFAIKGPGKTGAFGVAIVGRDLTLLREKEEQIRQGQKLEAIGHLAGGIAHDFNNILTVINGYGELLLERLQPGDPNRSLLDAMLDSGRRAAKLTAQLLAYGRKQVLQLRMLDLNDVMEETAGMLRRLISEDIELKLQLTRPLEKVKADPAQINQILLNLCLNARDAMAKGGVLLLETGLVDLEAGMHGRFSELPAGLYVTISISDTGAGMPPEVQDHLFEPFFTTKPVGMGTGLGLSSVYGIVRQSGGGIEVRSMPGKGTIFRVYLPCVPGTAQKPRIPEAGAETRMWTKGRILLVEDEEPVRKITRRLLENAGYSVLEAGDGVEALSLLEEMIPPPDLILTDAIMPKMGGPRLAEEVERKLPNQRILFMSGYSEEAFPKREGLGGEFHFLQKPFTFQALLNAVQEAMESRHIET